MGTIDSTASFAVLIFVTVVCTGLKKTWFCCVLFYCATCRKLGKSVIGIEREEEQRQRENNRNSWMFPPHDQDNIVVHMPSAPLLDCVVEEDDPPPSYQQAVLLHK